MHSLLPQNKRCFRGSIRDGGSQEEGKTKSFESMWEKIMIDSGKTEEDYRPKNLEDINEDI